MNCVLNVSSPQFSPMLSENKKHICVKHLAWRITSAQYAWAMVIHVYYCNHYWCHYHLAADASQFLCHEARSPCLGMPCLSTVPGAQVFSVWALTLQPRHLLSVFLTCTLHINILTQMSLGPLQGLAIHHQIFPSCHWVFSAIEPSPGIVVSPLCKIIFQNPKPDLHIQNLLCIWVLPPSLTSDIAQHILLISPFLTISMVHCDFLIVDDWCLDNTKPNSFLLACPVSSLLKSWIQQWTSLESSTLLALKGFFSTV